MLVAVVDGLKGFPDAITAVFQQATVQTCIVHLLRHSLDFVSYKDRKPVAAVLKDIYRAVDAAGGVKVYFSSYCHTGFPAVDAIAHQGGMDLLTLVFAATDKARNDSGKYFLIKPLGDVLDLPAPIARTMINAYRTKKMPFLTTLIKDAGIKNFNETKSFWYSLDKFYGGKADPATLERL